jgi:hypothetical protein
VLHEILGNLVEALVGRDDLVVLAEELIEKGGLIRSRRATPSFSPRFS